MQAPPPRAFPPLSSPPPATKLTAAAAAAVSYPPRQISAAAAVAAPFVAAPAAPILHPPSTETLINPAAESATAAFWDYQMLFLSQRSETPHPIPLRITDGAIPADFPRGTYYLTGPGIFSDDHGSTIHPLDGHGYLRAFEFGNDGAVRYSARYVETEAKREESGEGTGRWRFTHRGPFSVLRGGRRLGNVKVMKNVANTAVVRWAGRLLCLWEGGEPYEIDASTMGTIGAVDFIDGPDEAVSSRPSRQGVGEAVLDVAAALLRPLLYGVFKMPAKRLLSHYKIDAKRNRLLILSCNAEDMLLPRSHFTFYEFDRNFELKQKKEFTISDHLMIHDWAFTENHYILIGNRIKLDLPGSMLAVSGLSPMISALSVNPSQSKTPIYLLPRFEGRGATEKPLRDWRCPIEAPSQLWISHVANAFEEEVVGGSGGVRIEIQASACSYKWFNFQKMFGYNWQSQRLDPSFMNESEGNEEQLPHLVRVSVEVDGRGECRTSEVSECSSKWRRSADFPMINNSFAGQRSKFVYASTASGTRSYLPHFPFDSVVKVNCLDGKVSSWFAGRRDFIGEAMFVPKQGAEEEDDGYVVLVQYAVSKLRCYLVILDAKRIGRPNALIARLEVPHHLYFPLAFHGFWDHYSSDIHSID